MTACHPARADIVSSGMTDTRSNPSVDPTAPRWHVFTESSLSLMRTSAVMPVVGLLARVEPARRALTIDPTTALRDVPLIIVRWELTRALPYMLQSVA